MARPPATALDFSAGPIVDSPYSPAGGNPCRIIITRILSAHSFLAAGWLATAGKNYRVEIRWARDFRAHGAYQHSVRAAVLDAPSLFNLDRKIRVGIEDFLWAAAVEHRLGGGRNPSEGETVGASKSGAPTPLHALHRRRRGFLPWSSGIPQNHLQLHHRVCDWRCRDCLPAVRPDPTMFTGALSFTALYFALFLVFLFCTRFVQRYYNVPNLLGFTCRRSHRGAVVRGNRRASGASVRVRTGLPPRAKVT